MTLLLQTNIRGSLFAWVCSPKGTIVGQVQETVEYHGSERLMALVDSLLRRERIQPKQLKSIVVVRGPGAFSAVRTGIIVANTMAWILKIPVAGLVARHPLDQKSLNRAVLSHHHKKVGVFVRPFYGQEPNITRPKPLAKKPVGQKLHRHR